MSSIKNMFTSRFEGGTVIQFDYSQLEVIGLAWLSGDEQLKSDIRAGLDMHCMSASFAYDHTYEEIYREHKAGNGRFTKMRRDAKPLGFLVQYGGAAGLMAHQTGLPKKTCQQFIDRYYARYEGVKSWQDQVAADVLKNRKMSHHMVNGMSAGRSMISSPTGRRYTFIEQAAPEWMGKKLSFSPTQMKNFMVQGFATGDVVPMMLGRVNRYLKNYHPEVCLINTTHDSLMLDVPPMGPLEYSQLVNGTKKLLESAPSVLNDVFGIDFDMKLPVDMESGDTWGSLK